MKTPEFPADAPFSDQQQAWLTGFLAGLSTQLAGSTKNSLEESASEKPLHVLFGSQSGNAALVAEETCEAAEGMGLATILSDLNSEFEEELLKSFYIKKNISFREKTANFSRNFNKINKILLYSQVS